MLLQRSERESHCLRRAEAWDKVPAVNEKAKSQVRESTNRIDF
jgi:hypothetical protein